MKKFSKKQLEKIYQKFNKKEFIYPDPLWFLHKFKEKKDIEVVGLIASSLAYGNVKSIMNSIEKIMFILGDNPHDRLLEMNNKKILSSTSDFIHRFAKSEHISALLISIRNILKKYGTIENCFLAGYNKNDINILNTLTKFCASIYEEAAPLNPGHLIAKPEKKSSCKRLNLYLRWMVRRDDVDPGWWDIPKEKLIIPLDTHMHQLALKHNLTSRKGSSITTALEITNNFKKFCAEDPVKYDFALTRQGIRGESVF